MLFEQHKLTNHFRAMRRYLLLGQGDLFRHLMDLLKYAVRVTSDLPFT